MSLHLYLALKLVHILGATVLFGTGLGIAFFMWQAHRSGDPAAIAHTARTVVIADALFTATAVLVQPLSGWALMTVTGIALDQFWIKAALALYVFVGLCWLPVVWIQLKLRDLADAASRGGTPLPERYHFLIRVWFWLGWPAFAGVLAILVLMLWKPQ
ncbi:MAG: DUF2269 domain-containing protein [Alphaproteobacteria bacterium]|nr:DUF2269 domain-containing protein [Alphaproteobacteria bacterium]